MNMPGEKNEKGNLGYRTIVFSARVLVRVLVVVLFIVVVIFISRKSYSLGYEVTAYKPAGKEEVKDIQFTITMDMKIEDVGKALIEKGIIKESLEAFLIQESVSDYHGKFIPGTYTLNENMTVEEIIKTISTVPEEENTNQ